MEHKDGNILSMTDPGAKTRRAVRVAVEQGEPIQELLWSGLETPRRNKPKGAVAAEPLEQQGPQLMMLDSWRIF